MVVKTRKYIILSIFFFINSSLILSDDGFDVNLPKQAEKVTRKKRMRKAHKKEKNQTKKIRSDVYRFTD